MFTKITIEGIIRSKIITCWSTHSSRDLTCLIDPTRMQSLTGHLFNSSRRRVANSCLHAHRRPLGELPNSIVTKSLLLIITIFLWHSKGNAWITACSIVVKWSRVLHKWSITLRYLDTNGLVPVSSVMVSKAKLSKLHSLAVRKVIPQQIIISPFQWAEIHCSRKQKLMIVLTCSNRELTIWNKRAATSGRRQKTFRLKAC